MLDLQREALAVAQAHGIALTEAHHREIITIIDALDPAGYTSMAQDAIAALPMETDAFGGEVLRLGQEHHIPTPVNEVVVQALQAMEEVSATR
jgi:2-dehydropantoate 2-reductase